MRRASLFLFAVVGVLAATLLITLNTTPKYTAYASVLLDTRKQQITDAEAVLSGLPADSAMVDTEVQVLRSRRLAERVVTTLSLENDREFGGALPDPDMAKRRERTVDAVLSNLSVRREGLTYIIKIAFESERPDMAARIANTFANLYLREQMEAKFDATERASGWLNERLGELRAQVLRDEAAVQHYKIANNLLSASGATLTEQEISSYNQSLAQARADVAEDEARLATARRQVAEGSSGDDTGAALESPVVQRLREQRAEISRRVADLSGRYGERHPEMLKARRELADIDGQIQQEIGRVTSNLEAKVQVSRQRAQAVRTSLGGARCALATNNRAVVRLNELQRTADASRTLYESYLGRFKETSTQQGLEQSDASVVSKATIPTRQTSPNLAMNLALGLALGLAVGAMAVLLAELLDAGLTTARDIERRLNTAYLGAIPLLASVAGKKAGPPIDHVLHRPLSAFSESVRNLITSIQYARPGKPARVVAITSALPGEGKTTTAVCLARIAAMQGAKVIVVDCDLRRRAVNRLFRIEPAAGLLEVLNGEAPLAQAVVVDEGTGAHFMPLSSNRFTPKDIFGSAAMAQMLSDLKARYDLVILDTAPVLPVADTRVLAAKADIVMFLTRWRETPQHAVEAAFRLLDGGGAHIAGIALTQVDMRQQTRYGHGDPTFYYPQYKTYYSS